MTAVASPPQSPTSPHSPSRSPYSPSARKMDINPPPLPPINTLNVSKRGNLQRPPSYAKGRMSTYSMNSRLSERGSRPISQAFPLFHSSLGYALVRDFAYPVAHPSHYGPPPAVSEPQSGTSTPMSDRQRRLSDPATRAWDEPGQWAGEGYFTTQQLPQMAYGDGPPYSEDEDLHSPVVKSSRHKKSRSAHPTTESSNSGGVERAILAKVNEDGTKTYYVGGEADMAGGPRGEFITYRPGDARQLAPDKYRQLDPNARIELTRAGHGHGEQEESEEDSLGVPEVDESRFSRDYQFTIASPDEEMHGKAVALFDFERENENELPLVEGQIIWVSYRHGQGWLVAEDPKTGDAGLVPEEYVRLLRDIEGGLGSLGGEEEHVESGEPSPEAPADYAAASPIDVEHNRSNSHGEKNAAVVSSFSTSSKDLDPHPHLVGAQAGQTPPQVVHYGSQSNTPTIRSPSAVSHGPRNFEEIKDSSSEESTDTDAEGNKATR